MGLLRYEADIDPDDYAAEYTAKGSVAPMDEMADVRAWAKLRDRARRRYRLSDDEYEKFVSPFSQLNSPDARVIATGDASGLKREDVSDSALDGVAAKAALIGAIPGAAVGTALMLKGHNRPLPLAGAAGLSVLGGAVLGKLKRDSEKRRREAYNATLDKIWQRG